MFVHLHNHFEGSYSDSALRFDEGIKRAKELGQKAVALTDHGELVFPWRFHDVCREHGVKPLFGVELYFVNDARRSIERENNERYHLVALARNAAGLSNIYKMLSDAWVNYSYKERRGLVDWALLEKYHEGVIMLSGCYYNFIAHMTGRKGFAAGEKVLARYREIFGEDFYIEIGRHLIDEEDKVNKRLIELAGRFNMTPVATNDAHYLDAPGKLAHDVIMKTRFGDVRDFKASSDQYWMKTESEMRALGLPEEYLAQSEAIAEKCEDIFLAPVPAASNVRAKSAAALLASGEAAYVSKMVIIDAAIAERHVRGVFKADRPEIVRTITGLPRRSEPDAEHIAWTPGRPIGELIPLKRNQGLICTEWDEESCRKAGAIILPTAQNSFLQKVLSLFKK